MVVWMTEGPCVNFVMRKALFEIYAFSNFTRGSCLSYLHEKQTRRIQALYLSKLSRFGHEISVFKYTTGRYSEQPMEQPARTSRMFLHGKMDVSIFLMFVVAENTGSVNIVLIKSCLSASLKQTLHFVQRCNKGNWISFMIHVFVCQIKKCSPTCLPSCIARLGKNEYLKVWNNL